MGLADSATGWCGQSWIKTFVHRSSYLASKQMCCRTKDSKGLKTIIVDNWTHFNSNLLNVRRWFFGDIDEGTGDYNFDDLQWGWFCRWWWWQELCCPIRTGPFEEAPARAFLLLQRNGVLLKQHCHQGGSEDVRRPELGAGLIAHCTLHIAHGNRAPSLSYGSAPKYGMIITIMAMVGWIKYIWCTP